MVAFTLLIGVLAISEAIRPSVPPPTGSKGGGTAPPTIGGRRRRDLLWLTRGRPVVDAA